MCGHPGCPIPAVGPCAFSERHRRSCGTWWCVRHGHAVGERWLCPRHGAVVAALEATGDADAEVMADLTSAQPSVLLSVAAGIDGPVRRVLEVMHDRWFEGEVFREELFVRHLRERRERAWESSWKLVCPTGALATASLLVTDRDPGAVMLRVDHREVALLDVSPEVDAMLGQPPGTLPPPCRPALLARLAAGVAAAWEIPPEALLEPRHELIGSCAASAPVSPS
jgi:hypothetical protein